MTSTNAMLDLFKSMAERAVANPQMDLPTLRDMMEQLQFQASEPEDVTYKEVSANGVDAMWCTPLDANNDRVMLFTHGGGFVTNTMHSHRKAVGHIAKAIGIRALNIDYRRAPEHPYPAQLEDATAAYRWVLDQGIEPKHIITAGDSAGGNLATATVLALRDQGLALPAAVVAFSPFYDMELAGDTMDSNAPVDAFVQRPILDDMVKFYIGENGNRSNPLANPLHADLTGFPPIYLTAGSSETLLADSERMAKRAQDAGVETSLRVVPEMQHIYFLMAGKAREADDTIADIAQWVRPKLGLS